MAHNPYLQQKRWTTEEAEELWHMRTVLLKTRAECAAHFKCSMSSADMKYMALKSRMKRKGNLEGVNFWSNEDDDKLIASRAVDHLSWAGVALRFEGRTPNGCRDRYQHLQEQKRLLKPGNRSFLRAVLPLPTSLTAFICGDPLPGRSALDEKVIALRSREQTARLNPTYSFPEPVASLHPFSRGAASASKATPARDADAFLSERVP